MDNDQKWIEAIEAENNTVDLTNTIEDNLAKFIKGRGFKVIDKRQSGGCLWIAASVGINTLLNDLKNLGFKFNRAETPRATGRKPGYWWKPLN